VDKYEDSHVKPPVKSYKKQNINDVPTSGRHSKNVPSVSIGPDQSSHMAKVIDDSSHKATTSQDQLKMVRHKDSQMMFLTQLYVKKNTYDVPSSVRNPKNASSVSLNMDLSPASTWQRKP
jgi:hypothetical protein